MFRRAHPALVSAALLVSALGSQGAASGSVGPPPVELVKRLGLSPFYTQHLSARGFPIVASAKVSPFALYEARYLIDKMLVGRDAVRQRLIANKVRFSIMAVDEMTTAIPEHSDLRPTKYWDRRARGLGATRRRPSVSCGEENLLCYPGDPYHQENILIHEFAHAMHGMALVELDDTFDRRLTAAYRAAIKAGLWKGKYAATNKSEYWAEGVQSWFDDNRPPDHDHNHVNTRAELREYDPALAGLCEEVFGDSEWRYTKPADRSAVERAHLVGYDPKVAPRFRWPDGLEAWYRDHMRKKARRRGRAKALAGDELVAVLDADTFGQREIRRVLDAGGSIAPELLRAMGSFDNASPRAVRRRVRGLRCLRLLGPRIADAVVPSLFDKVAMNISRDDVELLHTLGQLAPGLSDRESMLRKAQRAKPKAPRTRPLPPFIRWVAKMRLWYDFQHRLVWRATTDVSALVKDLSDEDPLRRRFAAERLGDLGSRALDARDALIGVANTEKHPRITTRKGTGSLTADFHELVRDAAAIAVARVDPTHREAARGLTLLLQADAPGDRLGALMSITQRPGAFDVVPAVIHAVGGDDPRVAAEAVSTLGRIGDPRPEVVRCLQEARSSAVKELSIRAVAALRALKR